MGYKTRFVAISLIVFMMLTLVNAKSDKSKYKLEYQFTENSSRTYLITFKQNSVYKDESTDSSLYSVKVEDTVTKASKSKATIKRTFKGFKLSLGSEILYNNLNDGDKEGDKANVADVFKALQDESFEFKISSIGKVSGITGYKEIFNNALEKIFGKKKESDREETTKYVQNLLVTWLDKAVLESDISFVYSPLTRSSIKVDSTWKAKPKRRLNMSVDFDSPEEYKVESIENDQGNVIIKAKLRGELEDDETKDHKAEYNKSRGEFTFNQTSGEMVEFSFQTKAKYLLQPKKSDEDEEDEIEYEKSHEIDQTVEVKLISSSTNGNPKVKIVTNMGDFIVELYEDEMPNTVANFIELCEAKFYDDIRFHRVIKGFMIQVGCPYAKGEVSARAGTGDAGYKFADENLKAFKFKEKGLLAMANSGPDTNGSQIFITLGAADWLNGKHAIFGKVVDGMDIVDKIGNVQTSKPGDKPVNEVYIKETQILQKRNHVYKVERLN